MATCLAMAAAACAEHGVATVSLALTEVPSSVASISVFAVDPDRAETVASATVTPSTRSVLLGVPAEVPLEFRVVAWTNRPGPAPYVNMPAYVGSAERTIPLGSEHQLVAITVHRAGVLTILRKPSGGEERDPEVPLRLEAENAEVRPLSLRLGDDPGWSRSLILRTGRYTARVDDPSTRRPRYRVLGGVGMYVGPELESVAPIVATGVPRDTSTTTPSALRLRLAGPGTIPGSDDLRVTPGVPLQLDLQIEALDARGEPIELPEVPVRWSIVALPSPALVGPSGAHEGVVEGLPAVVRGLETQGPGRARLRATTDLPLARPTGDLLVSLIAATATVGPPSRLAVTLAERDQLTAGTELYVELLDAAGYHARAPGVVIDLGASDPWLYVPAGPTARLTREGRLVRHVIRASGPRALPTVLRATATSTTPALTLTATIALPALP